PGGRAQAGGGAAGAARGGAGALQRGPRAVRLRRLARPAGAAARDRQLPAAVRAPLRRPDRRARRQVHPLRGGRRQAHAAPDQRPARLLPDRPRRPAAGAPRRRAGAGAGARRARRRDPRVRRHRHLRPAAHGGGQLDRADAALPESDRQRHQVPRRRAATHPRLGGGGRRRVALLGPGQRHRDRAGVPGAHLHHVPTPAQPRRLPRHRDRAGDLSQGCRAPRRPNLGRISAGRGRDLRIHAPSRPARGVVTPPVVVRPIEILLVEDSPADVELTIEALHDVKVRNTLSVVADGIAALAFLRREGVYADAPHPDLVLLDLNLPRKDGRAVLAEIKADPALRRIPVVILTTSEAEQDVLKSYDLHANCYVTKPVDLEQFIKVVRSINDFWLQIVRLPSR